MTQAQAETAVTTSALIVAGMYAYRRTTEAITKTPPPRPARITAKGTAAGVLGVGELLPAGTWLTGAGVTFIALSVITSINGNLGGALAILVATGAILGNGQAVLTDVAHGIEAPQAKAAASPPQPAQAAAGPAAGNHPPTTVK